MLNPLLLTGPANRGGYGTEPASPGGPREIQRTRQIQRRTAQAWPGILPAIAWRIPDFGDVVGLRRLYRAAVENIRSMDIPDADKRAVIAEIKAQYKVAKAVAELGNNTQFWPLKASGESGT